MLFCVGSLVTRAASTTAFVPTKARTTRIPAPGRFLSFIVATPWSRTVLLPSASMKQQLRRSSRLQGLYAVKDNVVSDGTQGSGKDKQAKSVTKKRKSVRSSKTSKRAAAGTNVKVPSDKTSSLLAVNTCLPRIREQEILQDTTAEDTYEWVMGVDEAGRGPLAGPVVAAAAIIPQDIDGITDSKKLTKEEQREELYEAIVASPGAMWAVAVVDAKTIDEINILQATFRAMTMATCTLLGHTPADVDIIREDSASAQHEGCYVVCGGTVNDDRITEMRLENSGSDGTPMPSIRNCFALVDGNKVPPSVPCAAEFMVKGDGKEYCIGAASILAKVTRDRLMRQYDDLYPKHLLAQHKGYPSVKHRALIEQHGATPIHRRTFAPLKTMKFDENGGVIS